MVCRFHPLVFLLTAALAGAALGMALPAAEHPLWALVAVALGGLSAPIALHRLGAPRPVWLAVGLVLIVAAEQADRLRPPEALPAGTFRDPQPRLVDGVVAEPPRRTERGLRLLLRDVVVVDEAAGGERLLDGLLTLEVAGLARTGPFCVGARVRTWARLGRIHLASSPGVADVAQILLDRRIVARGRADALELVAPGAGPFSGRLIDGVRDRFRSAADRTDDQTGPLLEAMILGDQGRLDRDRQDRWRLAGITHILSISGLHVGVVALALDRVLVWALGLIAPLAVRGSVRRPAALLGVLGGWAYVLVAGAPVAAVRSAWMVTGLLGARVIVRHNTASSALGLAAMLSLLADPWSILDPSFQLSYAAVAALVVAAPLGRRLRHWLAGWSARRLAWGTGFLLEPLLASAICTVATLPILLAHFGAVPLAGLVTNVVAVPLSSIAVVLPGFLALMLASVGLAGPILWLSAWLAPVLDAIATWGAGFGTLEHPAASGLEVALATLGTVSWLAATRSRRFPRWRLGVGAISLAVSLIGLPRGRPDGLTLTFFAVGHGDAALVRFPNGQNMLVDGGGDPTGLRDVGHDVVLPGLAALGVERLDVVVLTHPHPDHYRGLTAVAATLPIAEFWSTGQRSRDPEFTRLMTALDAQGTTRRSFDPGVPPMDFGGVSVQPLYPNRPANARGEHVRDGLGANNNSLVLRVAFGSFTALMTGDVEAAAEDLLIRERHPIAATLLKVPHHGSRTSSTPGFLAAVHPALAVSGSADEGHFAFPDPDVEARYTAFGIPLWITGRYGALSVHSDGVDWDYGPAD